MLAEAELEKSYQLVEIERMMSEVEFYMVGDGDDSLLVLLLLLLLVRHRR